MLLWWTVQTCLSTSGPSSTGNLGIKFIITLGRILCLGTACREMWWMALPRVRIKGTPLVGWPHRFGELPPPKTTTMSHRDENSKRHEFCKMQVHLDYGHRRIQCLLEASVLVKSITCKREKNDLPIYCLELNFNNKVVQHENLVIPQHLATQRMVQWAPLVWLVTMTDTF